MRLLIEMVAFILCSVLVVVLIGLTAAALVCKAEGAWRVTQPPHGVREGAASSESESELDRVGRVHLTLVSSGGVSFDLQALAGHQAVGVVDGVDGLDRAQHRLEV